MTEAILPAPRFVTHAPMVLSENRSLRWATLFLLYIGQGLPLGLINFALPAWLAQNGASAAAIGGVLAMANLPWTFKLAYGVVMDRYAFLAMGRRRPWIMAGQVAMVGALLVMAFMNPTATEVALITTFAFALGMGSAVQDVAVDGLAADILPAEEIERVNGFMFGGQLVGLAIGTGLGGTLIAYQGLPAAAFVLTAFLFAILILVMAVRERPGERLLPWTRGAPTQRSIDLHLGALWPVIREVFAAMSKRHLLILIPAMIAATAGPGILMGLKPIFATEILGWEKDTFSGWTGQSQLFAGLPVALLIGFLAARWGARRTFIVCMLLNVVISLAMLAMQAHWANPVLFIALIFVTEMLRSMRMVAGGALSMRLCTPAIAATQFAVFMALLNLGGVLGGLALGWLDSLGGFPAMFIAMILCSLTAALFAFAAKVGR